MRAQSKHRERHRSDRVGWLRAAVLGANDGIVSTASLVVGVAAAAVGRHEVLLTGVAGLVSGALSMAAGEYVSVHSQADTEKADLDRERRELETDTVGEHRELMAIYIGRGLTPELARQVSDELMAHDALGAHARDELGITERSTARPLQAAWISAASFASFAAVPITALLVAPASQRIPAISMLSLVSLAALGALGGHLGGAPRGRAALRVIIGGGFAMAVTAVIGRLLGVSLS